MKKILAAAAIAAATMLSTTANAGTLWNGVTLNGVNFNGVTLNGVTLNGLSLNGTLWNGVTLNGQIGNGLKLNGVATGSQSGQVIAIELPGKNCPARGCTGSDEPNGQSEHGVVAPLKQGGGGIYEVGNGPAEHGLMEVQAPIKVCPTRSCSGADEPNGRSEHGQR
jgi:opacity protein-like surface antigen